MLLLISAAALYPAPLDRTPEQLVSRIVRYEEQNARGIRDAEFLSFFAPYLRHAIQRDTARSDVGFLDYDPLCQCQDNDGLKMRVVGMRKEATVARVDLLSGMRVESGTRLRLTLRRMHGEWKVADVWTANVPSLAAQLGAH